MYDERSGARGARVVSTRSLLIEAKMFFLNSEVSLMLQFFRTYFFCALAYAALEWDLVGTDNPKLS